MVSKCAADREHESRLTATDGTSDSDRERPFFIVTGPSRFAIAEESRVRPPLVFVRVSGVAATMLVRILVFVVLVAIVVVGHGTPSTLKKTRVQPVVCRSEDVDQRRDGRNIRRAKLLTRSENVVQGRCVTALEPLRLVGADDPEPNGGRRHTTQP
jgi:hypothetical protein